MNWILSILFLICYFCFNNTVGNYVISCFNYKKISTSQSIVLGLLATSCIQWIIAFPCQLLHLSWDIYFISLISVYISLLAVMIKYRSILSFDKENLKLHLKKYWLLYIMGIAFLYWSISSQMPYLEMNYDDHYYIGALVQQAGSSALSTENFFTGAKEAIPFVRLVNTYEINYGFWATLFHIDLPFFARFAMTYHNYIFMFMAFHAFFATLSKKNDQWLQFVILPFSILIIPGYCLQIQGLLKMYDDWQMNTAMWYGGSIIRTASLPICLMLAHEWVNNPTIKKTVFSLFACIALFSYSSVFLIFAISVFMIAIIMLMYKKMQNNKNMKWLILTVITLIVFVCIIKIGPLILEQIAPKYTESLGDDLAEYIYFRSFYGARSKIFILYAGVLLFLFMKSKDQGFRRMIVGIVLLSGILYCGVFDKFFILASFNVIFAGLRLMTGLQLLLMSFIGYMIYIVVQKYKMVKLPAIAGILLMIACSLVNIQKEGFFKQISYPGTGLSSYGFDYDRIITDEKLIPKVHYDIGQYLKKNDTSEPHRVISPYTIPYENGILHLTAGLSMSSNNIEVCMSDNYMDKNGMNWGIANTFNSFVQGDIMYDEIKDLLLQFKIEYIITPSSVVVNSLLDQGMELVVTSISDNEDVVYMIKTNIK